MKSAGSQTVGSVFRDIYRDLKDAKTENPHLEAGWIVEKYVAIDSSERITNPEKAVNDDQAEQIKAAISRRTTGEPLAYILGERGFCEFLFKVTPDVLIPRPETELLVEWASDWIEARLGKVSTLDVLDLGTGSGCIGLTLAKRYAAEITSVRVSCLDASKAALEVAKENAKLLNLSPSKVEFIHLDAKKASYLLKTFDLVLANPPYIDLADENVAPDVRKFEPSMALFAGRGGYEEISGWLSAIPNILKPEAAVGFEIGATQGERTLAMFRDLGVFSKQYIVKDYAKHDRFVCGEKAGNKE